MSNNFILLLLLFSIHVWSLCDICCPGRDANCDSNTNGDGTCCAFRSRCCLTNTPGQFQCCTGNQVCKPQTVDALGGGTCAAPLPPVPIANPLACDQCCLGVGMCGGMGTTGGSCCPAKTQCCLVGTVALPGNFQCCSETSQCVRRGAVNRCEPKAAPTCAKCCLGPGKCAGLGPNTRGSCCGAGESCCLTGSQNRPGAYTCCKSATENCHRSQISLYGLCVAKSNNTGGFTPIGLCQGLQPLKDPTKQTTLQCGVGTPVCPGPDSWCDTEFGGQVDNAFSGTCCPLPKKQGTDCNTKKFCHECTSSSCVWILDANACVNTCPFNQVTCLSGQPRHCPRSNQCLRHQSCELCAADGCGWLVNSNSCVFSCPPGHHCVRDLNTCPVRPPWAPVAGSSDRFKFSGSCSRRCGDVGTARYRLPTPYPLPTFTQVGEIESDTQSPNWQQRAQRVTESDGQEDNEEDQKMFWAVPSFGPPPVFQKPLRAPPTSPDPNWICSCDVACDDWGDCCYNYDRFCVFVPFRP